MSADERPTALITGSSRGIGRAIAVALGETHHIIASGRDAGALEDLVTTLPSAEALPLDVNDSEALCASLSLIRRLDVLVHSAGVAVEARFDRLTRQIWRDSFEVNVFAIAEVTTLLLPALRTAEGLVVFLNSGSGLFSYVEGAAYTGTKFALRTMADCLREEERATGVRVTSIHPGFVDTDMGRQLIADKGYDYDPRYFVPADAVARCVRLAVDMPPGTQLEMLSIRPHLAVASE